MYINHPITIFHLSAISFGKKILEIFLGYVALPIHHENSILVSFPYRHLNIRILVRVLIRKPNLVAKLNQKKQDIGREENPVGDPTRI